MPIHPDPELLNHLKIAVSRLPRATREIFLAHCLDDMSYEEIAKRRSLTIRKVERHIARAIYRLSKDVDERPIRWWERLLGDWPSGWGRERQGSDRGSGDDEPSDGLTRIGVRQK